MPQDIPVGGDITNAPECRSCDGHCCSEFTARVCRSPGESDDALMERLAEIAPPEWEPVEPFEITDVDYFTLVLMRCKHVTPDGKCGSYESRPQACRSYPDPWVVSHAGQDCGCPLVERMKREQEQEPLCPKTSKH